MRLLRTVTDPIAPLSFNRLGFLLNQQGFKPEDLARGAQDRIALVTGANSGIGRASALELARLGFEVWLLCRDAARGEAARADIANACPGASVRLGVVDLSSVESIRHFVREACPARVDVLVHNAGVLPHEKRLSADDVELTFATSVLGPFALTALLIERLSRSRDARVIFVASGGLYLQRLDLKLLDVAAEDFDGNRAYANAKRAQLVLAHLLADRYSRRAPITFASMHPGWADTTAVRTSLPTFHAVMQHALRSPEQGADTVVWLATSAEVQGSYGRFWFDRRLAREHPLPWTHERSGARERLLATCERLSGIKLPA